MTFVPRGGPGTGPSGPPSDPWGSLREELAADVRRVSDRLRSLSATRLASAPGPSVESADQGPAYVSRADAGRAAATELARAAAALEAAALEAASGEAASGEVAGDVSGQSPDSRQPPDLPDLPDLAVGDQVAVTGHDLLAALDGVSPAAPVRSSGSVWSSGDGSRTAEQAVRAALRLLTDVRRRL